MRECSRKTAVKLKIAVKSQLRAQHEAYTSRRNAICHERKLKVEFESLERVKHGCTGRESVVVVTFLTCDLLTLFPEFKSAPASTNLFTIMRCPFSAAT